MSLLREVIEPRIREHQGRIVKTMGDGILVEFSSPIEAVLCAVEVRKALGNLPQEPYHALQLRIGINLGDIIIEDDGDIYGDGVNVAARLEQMAEPGSIWISEKVYEEVRGKLPYSFEDRGKHHAKNIARSVRVYSVSETYNGIRTDISPAKSTLSLPDKPSIAVLPFSNMSGDPEQEFFADGMTEDITTGLSRLKWLFVIARNSTFTYKGKAVDVRQVARDLGVRYVLEGSVRTAGNRIRVTSQLIEAETGKHLWAEKYDRQVADVFMLQDEITENVLAAIEPQLYFEEGIRATAQPPEKLGSWELVVRAIGLAGKVGRKDNEEARALLQQAIGAEPTYAKAHAILSWATWWAAQNYWLPDEMVGKAEARRHAEAALALDPAEPWARMMLGLSLGTNSAGPQFDRALKELEAAIRINPSFALAHTINGWVLIHAGAFEAAEQATRTAMRLSPKDSFLSLYEYMRGVALLMSRQYDEAYMHLHQALVALPEIPEHHTILICCCGYLDRTDEAMALMSRRNSLPNAPRLTVSLIREQLRNYGCMGVMTEGLIRAGVPEA